jgi:hypothetical protein
MEAVIKSENVLRVEGMKLLIEGLGTVNAERFINCIKTDHFDSLRRVHTPAPWGGSKGMYPESNTLREQPYPVRSAVGLVDYTEWQQDLWKGKTIEDIHQAATAFYNEKHGE